MEKNVTAFTKNKRIVKNTLLLYVRMIFTMAVTLYTSRIILNVLGVEDYGVYNVVGGVVTMFAFFNSAMSNATQRFLSYEIGKGDFEKLRKIFNASQLIHIGIALLIGILAETIGLWFVKKYLVIPIERMEAAVWVYHFSVFAFIITVIQVPYNAIIIARERMNAFAYISVLEVFLKLIIVFMLTWLDFDKLKLYGVLYFVITLSIGIIYRVFTRVNFKETEFELIKDKELYSTLIYYSGWNLFGNIAGIAKVQGINILLNIFFGPIVNAARGIASQVQGAVNSFVVNFQIAVNPQIIKSYASGDQGYMTLLVIRSSKLSFYLLFLLSFPIIIEVEQILKLWLKVVPEYAPIFTNLVLVVVLIDCFSGPLMTAAQATGRIKVYQIVVGTLQFLILPLSYWFLVKGYSPEVAMYINIIISIIALFFRVCFLKYLLDFPVLEFIRDVVIKCALVVLVSVSLPLFLKYNLNVTFINLLLVILTTFIWTILVIYLIGLNKVEKEFLLSIVKKKYKK
ncbi:hypothetical protein HMPREF9713_00728 [Myroides odoratimimus CCUG 12700]|uniref:MATE family efflux transporter n=1 Tax=Myroides odoratimimus TaxID=76832 RepID=UPI000353CDB6|nr:MATE family efflux transporter [Myroides odoratimimus]EPH13399.1 hypothetical protein HMPREF9713_00728 [Myroides odoratimimus CCUG 12700]MCO7723817.1 MATE family efflux transporter [Myroides odoratimimus]